MKKNLLPPFYPPRIVKSADRWYILYYTSHHDGSHMIRYRKTFALNRIPDKRLRLQRAREICADILLQLHRGDDPQHHQADQLSTYRTLQEAINFSLDLKLSLSSSRETRNCYRSVVGIFLTWCESQRLDKRNVLDFSHKDAFRFMDHLRSKRKVGKVSYNNYVTWMRSLFGELLRREEIPRNPFKKVPKLERVVKRRREFLPDERAIVASYTREHYPWLYRAILLQYYGFIRPGEMLQLKFAYFNWKRGTVRIPAAISKNRRDRLVTLPTKVVGEFLPDFTNYPGSYFPFGGGVKPSSKAPGGKTAFNRLHTRVLKELQDKGLLGSTEGLSFYSWKDTGLTDHADHLELLDLMKQAGHQDPATTLIYVNRGRQSQKMRDLDNPII